MVLEVVKQSKCLSQFGFRLSWELFDQLDFLLDYCIECLGDDHHGALVDTPSKLQSNALVENLEQQGESLRLLSFA